MECWQTLIEISLKFDTRFHFGENDNKKKEKVVFA